MQAERANLEMPEQVKMGRRGRPVLWLVPALVAALLVFFPFDWLGHIWPAYEAVFARVFATALAHEIGHTTVFFLAGTALLFSFPRLCWRPGKYFLVIAASGAGEELIQSLFKLSLPTLWSGRDLLCDLCGATLAYGLGLALMRITRARLRHSRRLVCGG